MFKQLYTLRSLQKMLIFVISLVLFIISSNLKVPPEAIRWHDAIATIYVEYIVARHCVDRSDRTGRMP